MVDLCYFANREEKNLAEMHLPKSAASVTGSMMERRTRRVSLILIWITSLHVLDSSSDLGDRIISYVTLFCLTVLWN